MRIRPGRGGSILTGVAVLAVMIAGLAMMERAGGVPDLRSTPVFGAVQVFKVVWLLIGLAGAAASFYNAFSRRGLTLYEIDVEEKNDGADFCPRCGKPIGKGDRFCRNCGASVG